MVSYRGGESAQDAARRVWEDWRPREWDPAAVLHDCRRLAWPDEEHERDIYQAVLVLRARDTEAKREQKDSVRPLNAEQKPTEDKDKTQGQEKTTEKLPHHRSRQRRVASENQRQPPIPSKLLLQMLQMLQLAEHLFSQM
jgi:hypothetical protein